MKHKKLLSFLLAAVMTISLLPAFTIAVTAEEIPDVTISTLEELEDFRSNIADGNTYSGKLIKLTADIDMRGYYGEDINGKEESWGPIGLAPEFKGTFDGGNHKIIGLYSNRKDYCRGLFAIINGNATVKNLGIEGGSINGEGYVGGIAGCNRGTIENCYSTAEITGVKDVGGIVGFNEGRIINCYSVGNIKGTGDGVGGVVGTNEGTIENCYNIGNVSGEGVNIGGVVGANSGGTIEGCYYLAGTANGGINGSDVAGSAESITAEELRDESKLTNAGWSFDEDNWEMGGDYIRRPILSKNKEKADGGEYTPYNILALEDLEKLSSDSKNDNFAGKHFKMMADIDMSKSYGADVGGQEVSWTPIGEIGNFNGIFDGGNHKITGLYINSEENYQGLFGLIGMNGTVKNLGIEGGSINGEDYVGGIAGYCMNNIENCYNTAEITDNGECVGGIVGVNFGEIINCYNVGNVSGTGDGVGGVGGVVGVNFGEIINCYNVGNVSGTGDGVGGVIGATHSVETIEGCYYLAGTANGGINGSDVAGSAESITAEELRDESKLTNAGWSFDEDNWEMGGDYIRRPILSKNKEKADGGEYTPYNILALEDLEKLSSDSKNDNFAGKHFKMMADIDMSKSYGADVGGQEVSWTPIGGIGNFKGIFDGGNHKITGLYINSGEMFQGLFKSIYDGTVKNLGIDGGSVKGKNYVGGIAGTLGHGTVENCYNTAEITGESNAGGMVGQGSSEKIIGCYNAGNVSGTGNSVGGIVGICENTSLNGEMENCYNVGNISGMGKYVGGIAGLGKSTNMKNCYNIGNVSGTGNLFGGVIGYSITCTIEGCYYLADTANGGINGSDVAGSAERKEKEEFENGIVAYLLQGTQSKQIWGQRLKGDNADKYPVLSSKDKVYKISFMTRSGDGYAQCAEAGANSDGMAKEKLPKPDSDDYEFVKWVTEPNVSASEFNENTAVTEDMTVYALGNEITDATAGKNYTIEMTYDEEINEINLNDYVENKSGNNDSFTFTLTQGSLPEGLSLNPETGKITGTPKKVETQAVTFSVNNSGIMLMSLGFDDETESLTLEFKVNKADSSVTKAPKKAEGLIYTGDKLALLSEAGTAEGGTLKYSLDGKVWYDFDKLPGEENAGEGYKVWYKVEGDENHNDTDAEYIENIKIEQMNINGADIKLGETLTYTGDEQTQAIESVKIGGLSLIENADYTVSENKGKNAGNNYKLILTGKGNFKGTAEKEFTIEKAASVVTKVPVKAEGLIYTGGELALLSEEGTAEGGTLKYSLDGNVWYNFNELPKVMDAKDSYKVWYKVEGDENHNDTVADSIDIKVAEKTISPIIMLTAPVKYEAPQKSIETDEYMAMIDWSPEFNAEGLFARSTIYTAEIKITAKPNYTVVGIAENGYMIDDADEVKNTADSNTVTVVFPRTSGVSGGGGSSSSSSVLRYTVKFDANGGSTVESQRVIKDDTVQEPAKPVRDGYIFDGWYLDEELTEKYDFDTIITKNITLYAKWTEEEIKEPEDNKDDKNDNNKPEAWENPFTDVRENDWFFESVSYAGKNGLMSGISNTEFAPNLSVTRGMLVTVLYRAEGEPAVNKSIPFADVKADSYYCAAVIWAQQNGIVKGITETEFAPDENVTREQLAAIMYRYAEYKGYDVSVGESTNILSYTDFEEISEYAIEALQYAVGSGLMKGKTESTLNPNDFTTRAEIAMILQRFIENI